MGRERNSRTKAIITLIVVLLLTAVAAYFLHLRPAEEAVTTPAEIRTPAEAAPRPATP